MEKQQDKRKPGYDRKGRKLLPGETQEKNGRYRYTYYVNKSQKCFYSWKLEDTDRLPKGKRPCESLRWKIKELNKAKEQGIAFRGNNLTVRELVEKYLALHDNIDTRKHLTKVNHNASFKHLCGSKLAYVRIDKVKRSDAKLWIKSLSEEAGLHFSSIKGIIGIVRPAFEMAVQDDILLKNPFAFTLTDIVPSDYHERFALTEAQKDSFLDFIKNDPYYNRYYDPIVVLFETGLRIAEFCGLTLDRIDLRKRTITIDCQLHYDKGYYIEAPKTKDGIRTIPLTDMAYQSLQNIINDRITPKKETIIDGRSNFLMLNRDGKPHYGGLWNHYFSNICKRYNEVHQEALTVTPHICRHTFATRMAYEGMQPFILKNLMGHDSLEVTNRYYIHKQEDRVVKELERLNLRQSMDGQDSPSRLDVA